MPLALVTRIPSLAEAQIAAGALRSAGIRAEVFDSSFGGVEAPVIEGLGGCRLMAPEEQAEEARQLLRALQASPLDAPEDSRPWSAGDAGTPPAGRRGMRLLAMAVLGAPTLYWLARLLLG